MKIVFDILMAQLLRNKRDAAACVYFFLPPKVGILSYSIFILRFMSQCYHICVLHLQMKDSSFPKPFQRGRFPYSYYWIILFGLLYVLNREAINLGLVKKKLRITIILKVITRQLYFFIIIFVVLPFCERPNKQLSCLLVSCSLLTVWITLVGLVWKLPETFATSFGSLGPPGYINAGHS